MEWSYCARSASIRSCVSFTRTERCIFGLSIWLSSIIDFSFLFWICFESKSKLRNVHQLTAHHTGFSYFKYHRLLIAFVWFFYSFGIDIVLGNLTSRKIFTIFFVFIFTEISFLKCTSLKWFILFIFYDRGNRIFPLLILS